MSLDFFTAKTDSRTVGGEAIECRGALVTRDKVGDCEAGEYKREEE